MKILSRDFTLKEKIMLLVLGLILLALAWYRFVYIPCTDAVAAANSERDMMKTEMIGALAKETQLRKMKEELDSIGELQTVSRMESYNNAKAELTMLNNVLENANDYSINFSSVTKTDEQIRRNFSLTFETIDFAAAKRIVEELTKSEYRCLLGDMQYNVALRRLDDDETAIRIRMIDGIRYGETVSVTTTATFFETMYGGTPDAGLPAEKE